MNHILFDKEKFRGNHEQYYDPDNIFLNRVLDRKTGIPISLCLIYIEVAGRLGLDVRGIGLPGHFIAALYHPGGKIYIDPYNRGEIAGFDEDVAEGLLRDGIAEPNAPIKSEPEPGKKAVTQPPVDKQARSGVRK